LKDIEKVRNGNEKVGDDHSSCHSADVMGGCHMEGITQGHSKAHTFIFVIALSIHSFLEGLGMAALTNEERVIKFTIGLLAHKWLEAFALGVSVLKASFKSVYSFGLISVYSILTPLGIGVGMAIQSLLDENNKAALNNASVVLNGLASGSFLFVACIEMIPPEFHKKNKHTVFKFITMVFGFAIMAVVTIFHSH